MKRQGTGNREQATESTADGMEELLKRAIPRVGDAQLPERDLWPAMRQRIAQEPAHQANAVGAVPWFDWALAGGLAVLAVMSPALIPVLLYYL